MTIHRTHTPEPTAMQAIRRTTLLALAGLAVLATGCETNKVSSPVVRFDRTGQGDVWKKVVKNYPATTHARTVEYRLTSREQLNKIFAGAEDIFHRF